MHASAKLRLVVYNNFKILKIRILWPIFTNMHIDALAMKQLSKHCQVTMLPSGVAQYFWHLHAKASSL